MGLFGPKIEWNEPWSWTKVRNCAAEIRREYPPMWKMLLYCAVLPALVLGGVILYCQHVGLDGQALEQTRRNFYILPPGCVLMFMVMPYLYALCPLGVIIRGNYISFIRGNSVRCIKVEQISSLCFRTIDDRRYFVVRATTARGKPFEQKIEMPAAKVTEQDVVKFLYDVGLAHLCREEVVHMCEDYTEGDGPFVPRKS